MDSFRTITVESTESTNTYARQLDLEENGKTPIVVITDCQTKGRGQRGNYWESEAGKNLTFSLIVFPDWLASRHQFELSMVVSVALINTLRSFVDSPDLLTIKWPNDIYFGDKKIAGILIENTIVDNYIEKSVIGIGINVNQKEFLSDAPNPISLFHVTGFYIDKILLLKKVVSSILDMLEEYENNYEPDELSYLYNNLLWRKNGEFFKWKEEKNNNIFKARIDRVELDGHLILIDEDGNEKCFLFKEVSAIL